MTFYCVKHVSIIIHAPQHFNFFSLSLRFLFLIVYSLSNNYMWLKCLAADEALEWEMETYLPYLGCQVLDYRVDLIWCASSKKKRRSVDHVLSIDKERKWNLCFFLTSGFGLLLLNGGKLFLDNFLGYLVNKLIMKGVQYININYFWKILIKYF